MTIRASHSSKVKFVPFGSQRHDIFRRLDITDHYKLGSVRLNMDPSDPVPWHYIVDWYEDFQSKTSKWYMQSLMRSQSQGHPNFANVKRELQTFTFQYAWNSSSKHYGIMSRCEKEILENNYQAFLEIFYVESIDCIDNELSI